MHAVEETCLYKKKRKKKRKITFAQDYSTFILRGIKILRTPLLLGCTALDVSRPA